MIHDFMHTLAFRRPSANQSPSRHKPHDIKDV